jgi:hypothetical protein
MYERILLSVDLVGAIAVMVEAAYYRNQFVSGCGCILALTALWLFSRILKD